MNLRIVFALVIGLAVMAATVLVTNPGTPKSAVDPAKRRYMHCPQCNREQMFHPDYFEKPCPYCEKQLVATEESVKASKSSSSRSGLMYVLLGIELIALMAAVLFVAKQRQREAADDDYLYVNCAKCGQKIRFRERQVGTAAMCRRCRHAFIYPAA